MGRVTGLVLSYGYVEDALPGFDVWGYTEGSFPNTWEALRSLASYLLPFYRGGLEVEKRWVSSQAKPCCSHYKGKKLSEVLLSCVKGEEDKNVVACPECGLPIYGDADYSPDGFATWILDGFHRSGCEHPEFYDGYEWERDAYELWSKRKWPLISPAEIALVVALPEELVPEAREAQEQYIEDHELRLSDDVKQALEEWQAWKSAK